MDTDNYGALIDVDELQTKMITGTYLFARILIYNILMKAGSNQGGGPQVNDVVEDNFKIVSSVIYYIFMQVLNSMMKGY
jgi:hypothetical protein